MAEKENNILKYLTFRIDQEILAIDLLKVQEIIGMMKVTKIPKTFNYLRGIINLRGKVIPVIDLRLRFDYSEASDTEKTCIIVVQTDIEDIDSIKGIIVDEVCEVLDIESNNIEQVEDFNLNIDESFIKAIAKVNQKVISILELKNILGEIGGLQL